MMATHPIMPGQSALPRFSRCTSARPFSPKQAGRLSRSHRPQALPSHRSVDLAGRTVSLSPAIPAGFDAPLDPHHKAIGRWVAEKGLASGLMTRSEARKAIEQEFDRAVQDIFGSFDLADLRFMVLEGGDKPPAIAIICDSIGQIELGWIEKTNVLRQTIKGSVAPVEWRARAYKALADTLSITLPIFGYGELIEELSMYYWDGDTDDDSARRTMVDFHGADPDDLILPSHVAAKRPDFMLAENAGPLKALPGALRARLKRLQTAYDALKPFGIEGNAWYFEFHELCEYAPEYEECATIPPMTLVPSEQFGMELDEVGRMGMEMRFLDIAGLCPLTDHRTIERWFASLRLGAELLAAASDLISIDPTGERA